MTRIKICGITTAADAQAASEAGADAIGLVFAPSPRRVTLERAREIVRAAPPLLGVVGVFVDPLLEELQEIVHTVHLAAVQLHGAEPPSFCRQLENLPVLKRFAVADDDTPQQLAERMRPYTVAACLLDPGAGSGRTFRWEVARDMPHRLIVSGGLTSENVGRAIRTLRPYAVDVSSGVERSPGVKDAERIRAFVQAVRNADADLGA